MIFREAMWTRLWGAIAKTCFCSEWDGVQGRLLSRGRKCSDSCLEGIVEAGRLARGPLLFPRERTVACTMLVARAVVKTDQKLDTF